MSWIKRRKMQEEEEGFKDEGGKVELGAYGRNRARSSGRGGGRGEVKDMEVGEKGIWKKRRRK